MAYAVTLDQPCTENGCSRRATHEVRNWHNEKVRVCCRRHAWALVQALSADEEAR